ncbi:hypothetical protein PORUE0001_1676 [Porphyromonas uenonis 60-3]|uniref:Major fimbrial subunit protein N-terminal domain-containing protein n=1 Tax=Porphyromonas uenonis 60-3 TaxID=596327 RepID=C2MBT9_9PORP|nr:DUF5110 domain-containing protein [Porphyromonas uenonis]EEK16818.1 hypothetical protein PORUE0001_1676 [Porphyromonas uenonis 60-3]
MNRLRYTHIYTFLLILGALLTSTSCVRDYNTLECEDDGNKYLTLTLSLAPSGNEGLRTQGPDYSINSDKDNREDYVNDLRIFLIQNGVIKKNVFFTNLVPKYSYDDYSSGSEDDGVSYNYKSGKAQVTFRLTENELGEYDLVVVANEGAYTNPPSIEGKIKELPIDREKEREEEADAALRKALREAQTLKDLKKIRIPVTRRYSDTHQGIAYEGKWLDTEYPYVKVLSPMTAEYKKVDFSEGGTKENPRKIVLPTQTGGIELLRTFAKVDITIKDCVLLYWEDGEEKLRWRGPWGFGREMRFKLRNVPEEVNLFPIPEYSKAQDFIIDDIGRVKYPGPDDPQEDFVKDLEEKRKEIKKNGLPIGGGYLLDYRHYFYIPEKLVSRDAEGEKNALQMIYVWSHIKGPDPWQEISEPALTTMETKVETFDFDKKNAGASKYLEPLPAGFAPSDKSVFRNSLYKITITPYRYEFPQPK